MSEYGKTLVPWGEWIRRRGHYVGIRSQVAIAKAVGCSFDQLARWIALESPPEKMLKGFDGKLCQVLLTDRPTLFISYATIAPEDAPILDVRHTGSTMAEKLDHLIAGKSKSELARRAGITTFSIDAMLSGGNFDFHDFLSLACILRVPASFLTDGSKGVADYEGTGVTQSPSETSTAA